jgi:hypothetical protein
MTGHVEYIRVYTGRMWIHFWTNPMAFNVWMPCEDESVCTPEFLEEFLQQNIARIRKIPKRLWVGCWAMTTERADEYRKYT